VFGGFCLHSGILVLHSGMKFALFVRLHNSKGYTHSLPVLAVGSSVVLESIPRSSWHTLPPGPAPVSYPIPKLRIRKTYSSTDPPNFSLLRQSVIVSTFLISISSMKFAKFSKFSSPRIGLKRYGVVSRLHYVENRWSRSNIEISASICFTIVARGGELH